MTSATLRAPAEPLAAVAVADALLGAGFGPFYGVPCSFLGPLIQVLQDQHPGLYQAAGNEGEAVALAAGARLAGRLPVVILQNSGLGNGVNPLTSLCHTLRIPVLLLITWRGRPGHPDEPQHELMGRITPDLLAAMEIRSELFPANLADLPAALSTSAEHLKTGKSFAFIVPKGTLAPLPAEPRADDGLALRAEAIAATVQASDPATLLVATTGKTARELERDWDRDGNLYVVGSMGCAASVGLGVALNAPDRFVTVIDGDGAVLMRMEAMATIGRSAATRFTHVVLDNEAYESTGGQLTHSAGVDFAGIAAACGYRSHVDVSGMAELGAAVRRAQADPGPHFIRVRIRPGSDPKLGRPALTPPEAAARFARAARA
ncbi:phosphonopyruvate decarboxylase [Amycolatopsis xylanica]|uniref:Phosphonopyruvate decarboxylase n=1 Tax=Amycolatopsis xylanica TaxID=589385 RepID=A0A1H2TWA8_9PSEU|nr:phosphonopyruvate decarboxylase [Amycolatopsis xylanica]SDW47998.1 phosphonopyruvate decarboxylase [Amycolatopsis xylanica]